MGFHEKEFWKCVLSCLFYIIFYLWSLFPIFAIFRIKQSEALRLVGLSENNTLVFEISTALKNVFDLMPLYLNRISNKGVKLTHP